MINFQKKFEEIKNGNFFLNKDNYKILKSFSTPEIYFSDEKFVKNRLFKSKNFFENDFDLINSKKNDSFFLYIPKNFSGIYKIVVKSKKNFSLNLKINVGERSKCFIFFENIGNHPLSISLIDFLLEKNSEVFFLENTLFGNLSCFYTKKNFFLSSESNIRVFENFFSFKKAFTNSKIFLKGEKSSCFLHQNFFSFKSNFESNLSSFHLSENTNSGIFSKCLLKQSIGFVKGLVEISKKAKGSDGYQRIDSLLLDNSSRIISVPNLRIKNSFVKCTHGATVSSLDKEKIFYMQARGLSEKNAKEELIKAFFYSSLKDFPEEAKNSLIDKIDLVLKNINY